MVPMCRALEHLRATFQEQGLSLGKAQRRLGCGSGMLSRWMNRRQRPSVPWALQIQETFGTPIEWWTQPPSNDADTESSDDATG